MPPIVDKIKLTEKQDRRRKLTTEQHKEIRRLYKTGKYSQSKLAVMFGVSRSTITLICNPAAKERQMQRTKEHWRDYQKSKEERRVIAAEHRAYKRSLYVQGVLGRDQEGL